MYPNYDTKIIYPFICKKTLISLLDIFEIGSERMKNQNRINMNAYVLSKDNARTFAEFTLKMKNETENGFKSGTEYFYIIDKLNEENNMKSPKKLPIGNMLVIILNKYDKIKKVLENHKNMIYNAEKERTGDYRDSLKELSKDLTNISKVLSIFNNFIDSFKVDVYYNYHKVLDELFNKIQNCEYFDHNSFKLKEKYIKIKEETEKLKDNEKAFNDYINTLSLDERVYLQSSNYYKNLQEQFIYMSTAQFLKDKCISFFDNWLNEFEKMKKIVDNSFVPTDENSRYYTFSGITIQLPSPTIEFSKSKKSKETKYKYELSTLTDFIYASLYHLQLEGLRIIKCPYCGNYFIPKKLNQTWCGKEYKTNQYGKITCKDYRSVKNSEHISNAKNCESLNFYKAIYRRLQHNHKEEFEKFIQNYNYQEKRKQLEQKYSSEEQIEQELLKWLTKYDKEFLEKFPSKTRKPTTTKYWFE